jgi:hypothetical protein
MFHQVKMRKEDQGSQRFLWRAMNRDRPPDTLIPVMFFGATCSLTSAQYVKNRNALEFKDQFPEAAKAITEHHYVDDYLGCTETVEEAIKLARDVIEVYSKGGFYIYNWGVPTEQPRRKVLLISLLSQAQSFLYCHHLTISFTYTYYTYTHMNPYKPSGSSSKRKTLPSNSSESSEGSPLIKNTPKRRSTIMEPLTKADLMELRTGMKNDVKDELTLQLQPIVTKVSLLEKTLETGQKSLRANNIILHGIVAVSSETTQSLLKLIEEVFKNEEIHETILIDNLYHLGHPSQGPTRPLLVKFVRNIDQKKLLLVKKSLATKAIYISDDLTPLQQFNRKLLTTHLSAMKRDDASIWGSVRGNSLHIKKDGYVISRFEVTDGVVQPAPYSMSP